MRRNCNSCREPYEAVRSTSKYCSARCRVRASKLPKPDPVDDVGTAMARGAGPSLYLTALREFEAAGVAGSTVAQLALSLAERLDSPGASDASRSPMSREFNRLRGQLLLGVDDPDDPVEILRARVRAKRLDEAAAGPQPGRFAQHPLSSYVN